MIFGLEILLLAGFAKATPVQNIPQIGVHYPILFFEKNENPQNKMVIYTKLDEDCNFTNDSVDFYWLMNGERYKPVHRMIKSGIRDRTHVTPIDEKTIVVALTELERLKLPSSKITVRSERHGGGCQLRVEFKNAGQMMEVKSVYSEAHKTLVPPFRKVDTITLKGTSLVTNEPLEVKFKTR